MYILFGDQEKTGTLPSPLPNKPAIPYIMLSAPRSVWSEQTLDIEALFAHAGLKPPAPLYLPERNLEFPLPMFNFRLFFASQTPAQAYFGSVTVPVLDPDTDSLIQQVIQSPQQVQLWRGDLNRETGNMDAARAAYDAVLAVEPDNAAALYGVGRIVLDNDPMTALAYFSQALKADYAQPILLYEGMGEAYLMQENFAAAQTTYEKAIEMLNEPPALTPSMITARIYKGLGKVLLKQDRALPAESALNQALQSDGWDAETYQLLQDAAIKQGRCNSAAAYQQAAEQHGFEGETLPCGAS